jgi:hypothetical protein
MGAFGAIEQHVDTLTDTERTFVAPLGYGLGCTAGLYPVAKINGWKFTGDKSQAQTYEQQPSSAQPDSSVGEAFAGIGVDQMCGLLGTVAFIAATKGVKRLFA